MSRFLGYNYLLRPVPFCRLSVPVVTLLPVPTFAEDMVPEPEMLNDSPVARFEIVVRSDPFTEVDPS